tara:strand:+ start:1173 stop:1505 length:333 start_codon:yes stop_codon:yes gene_type:complete
LIRVTPRGRVCLGGVLLILLCLGSKFIDSSLGVRSKKEEVLPASGPKIADKSSESLTVPDNALVVKSSIVNGLPGDAGSKIGDIGDKVLFVLLILGKVTFVKLYGGLLPI